MSEQPDEPPAEDPHAPAFRPTDIYDEAAIKRARELLNNMPESVGPYRILERIGGGGMGEVYRAEQRSPIRRQVALKFIKLGMDTKLVIARFEAERQALALMDNPHIAKVFDAGTDEIGRPYFVMEYVKGKPITEYADQNHLTIRERLELFEQVCQAIQHAHHKGIIHRDLKPGNVLVSTQDDKPFAKVIDFGIAKAIAQQLTDGTLFTEHDQFVGTPQYMSPEQADGCVDIDTRTDVYSLGVLLYELLTGSTPFSTKDLRAAAFAQIKKLIIEVDPPKPSTRLSLTQPTLSTLAASRRTEPKRLGSLVQGELDWIVMKSIEKDRQRRYETPTSLAHDIQAHLHGEPVQAAPPSTAYLVQKFVKKHRGPVIAVSLIGAVLILGIIGTTWGYYRAEQIAVRERQAKERESTAKQDAKAQRDVAIQARQQAVAAQDQAEGALARGFVRPLVGADVLAPNEIESLWELATLESDTIGLRMLDEATRNPQTTEQLLLCAEPALVAAIGLNPDLRQQALALLCPRLNDQSLTLDHRAGIAWIMLMLLDNPGPDKAACKAVIKDAFAAVTLSRTPAQSYPITYSERAATLLEPKLVAEFLLAAFSDPKPNVDDRNRLMEALHRVSHNLERNAVAHIAEVLLAELTDPKWQSNSSFVTLPDWLLASLEPNNALRIAETLLASLSDPNRKSDDFSSLVQSLIRLSARLEPTAATRICESASNRLVAALADPNQIPGVSSLAYTIAELSARMEPTAAARVCASTADRLLEILFSPTWGARDRYMLPNTIAALSSHLEPIASARIADALLAVHSDSQSQKNVKELNDFAWMLFHLSKRLEPNDVARVCTSAMERSLTRLVESDGDANRFAAEAWQYSGLIEHLEPATAGRFANMLLMALSDPKRTNAQITSCAIGCGKLSMRLEASAAARVCELVAERLLVVINDPNRSPEELSSIAGALTELSAHLEPAAVARIADALLIAFADSKGNAHVILSSSGVLTALSARLDSDRANQIASDAAQIFAHQRFSRLLLEDRRLVASFAECTRHLAPVTRQNILRELFALRLEQQYEAESDRFPTSFVREILSVVQRHEPHHAAMATPAEDEEAGTKPTNHAFSTLKLTTSEIVEFLKSPLVSGDHRRAFLDLLECRYGRRFGNQWAFVEYAQAENLGLDFTTRVKRPDPKAILQNIRKLLDDEAK